MLKIEYKLDEQYAEKLASMKLKQIKKESWLEGNFIFETKQGKYSPPHCNPDVVMTWINFLPLNDNGLIPDFEEDIWGTHYYLEYQNNIFTLENREDENNIIKIFQIEIQPKELTDSFYNMIIDLHDKLLKINPTFESNNEFKLLEQATGLVDNLKIN